MEPQNHKNLLLAFALSLLVLIGWQLWFAPPPPSVPPATTPETTQSSTQAPQSDVQPDALPPTINGERALTAQTPVTAPAERTTVIAERPHIVIDTPRLIGSIALRGGRLDDLTLIGYRQELGEDSADVNLLSPNGSENPYYADFGWFANDSGVTLPDADTLWQSRKKTLHARDSVTLFWVSPDNIRFEKTFTLDDNYMFQITQRVVNQSGETVTLFPYGLVARIGEPDILNFYILHEGFLGVINGQLIEEDYDDIADETARYQVQDTPGKNWFGITDKYWLTALIPQTDNFTASFQQGKRRQPIYQADFYTPAVAIAAGESHQLQTLLFAGAKEVELLDGYAEAHQISRFDLGVDFGVMYFITKPIFLVIQVFSNIFGNFGVAILALTVVIKILFFPLANRSYKSISKMKQLQPLITELRERYGEDKQKLQQEMMRIYKEKKINPMAGCIPLLLQIPVFFALYKVLFVTIEMRHAPFFGWIQDLSAPDPLGILTLFGLVPWQVPAILAVVNIGIWPILMGISMWIQQKLNPAPPDPMQQKIFAMLPFIFTFLLASFPAGLVIYWTCNNSLTILQQWLITRKLAKTPV